jgi:hypothetical protein
MNRQGVVRTELRSASGVLAFGVTFVLLLASLLPLLIMVRTAFMSVGDPIEGTPAEIVLAVPNESGLTLHNMPMTAGYWDDNLGFTQDDTAWQYWEVEVVGAKPGETSTRFDTHQPLSTLFGKAICVALAGWWWTPAATAHGMSRGVTSMETSPFKG